MRAVSFFPVEIKSTTDTAAVVAGWGVVFGGRDLQGDTFTPATELALDIVPQPPVFYDHTLGDVRSRIGRVVKAETRDFGVWIEAEIDRAAEYADAVLELVKRGALGWSSGSVPHLVERKGGELKRWPVYEWSLTPTPAEPRTVGAERIKSVDEASAVAETGSTRAEADAEQTPVSVTQGANDMTPEDVVKLLDERDARKAAEVKAANEQAAAVADAEKRGRDAALAEMKAARKAPAFMRTAERGDDNDGVKAWRHWLRTGDDKPAEMTGFQLKAAMNEGTGSQGEYLVPDGFDSRIWELLRTRSVMRAAGASVVQTSLKMVEFPKEDTSNAFALTAEAGAYSESEPALGVRQVTVYKATNLIKVSDELLSDTAANLDGFLQNQISWGQATLENTWFMTGTGTGQPLGAIAGGTLGNTTAASGAITAAEVVTLMYALGDRYAENGTFFMARSTLGYLRALTGNWFQLQDTPAGRNAPRAGGMEGVSLETILGAPIFQTSAVAAIAASAKTALFCDPSQYVILQNGSLTVSRNPYLYQANGQVGIFSHFRVGGSPMQAEAFQYLAQHS